MKDICKKIRKMVLLASYDAKACHIGSSLSCVEILVDLYWKTMKKEDVFIFSKASGTATLYSVLSEKEYFPKEKLVYYLKHYPLADKEVPGVVHSVGSLGHGLPVAVGLALADRDRDVYCLIGDAEIQEGTTWESILFARHHKLKNLKIIVDRNFYQACGHTEDILKIDKALELLNKLFPIRIERTTKGKGVDFCENDYKWHYKNLDKKLLEKALKQIRT